MEFNTITESLEKINSNKISIVELNDIFINRIKKNKNLNAFIYFDEENISQQIKKIQSSKKNFKLKGIPLAIKDLFCTKNMPTTAGSKILQNFQPSYESHVSQKLLDQGSIFLGKANCDEFAMGSATNTSYYGNTINPISPRGSQLVPGGSSGGSAAAVAANLCLGATGTDTGGSIRQPASFCGVVGIKPTYGLCSRWGIIAFASSLDQAGVFANNIADTAILLREIAGHDNKDSTSANREIPNYFENLNQDMSGKVVGVPKEYILPDIPEDISKIWEQAIKSLERGGVKVKNISLPHTKYALPAYYIIAPAEASSNLARYDGVRYGFRSEEGTSLDEMYELTRSEGFGKEVKRRVLIGTYVLSSGYYDAYYLKAQKVRKLIKNDFDEAYKKVDAILTPSTPSAAFKIGEKKDDPVSMYLNDIFTVPVNLAGLPAISVPAGYDKNNLPLGLQLIGKPFDEQTILNLSLAIEKSANFKRKINVWWN